jgi:translation initiation factor IF-3
LEEVRGNIIKQLRVNQRIRAKEVRVIGEAGEQLGIMPLHEALQLAREHNLDLVEVAGNVVPPVCRLLDYGRYKYEQTKKERKMRKGQRSALIREIRLRPKIDEHDLNAKTRMVRKLLKEGDKVKVSVVFRGREITHPEIGYKVLQRMSEALKEVATLERPPSVDGPAMHLIFSPAKNVKEAKTVKEA